MQVEIRNFGCSCNPPQPGDPQPTVIVTLSKRNLLALLDKLSWDDSDPDAASARTIFRDCDDVMLVLKAEQDEEHYQARTPGKMHPKTEEALLRMEHGIVG